MLTFISNVGGPDDIRGSSAKENVLHLYAIIY